MSLPIIDISALHSTNRQDWQPVIDQTTLSGMVFPSNSLTILSRWLENYLLYRRQKSSGYRSKKAVTIVAGAD